MADLCVELTTRKGSSTRVERNFLISSSGKSISDAIVSRTKLLEWACPTRSADQYPYIAFVHFCGKWQKDVAIRGNWPSAAGCGSYHGIDIFDDGTVYFYSMIAAAGAMTAADLTEEEFLTIPPSDVRRLVSELNAFGLRNDYIQESGPASSPSSSTSVVRYETLNTEDLLRFGESVRAVTGWKFAMPAAKDYSRCNSRGPAGVSLRPDLYIAPSPK